MVTHSQLASVWLDSIRAQVVAEIPKWDRVMCDETPEGFQGYWPEALAQFNLHEDIPSVLMHLGLEVSIQDEEVLQSQLEAVLEPLREAAMETWAFSILEGMHNEAYLAAARYF